jgi:hypothetical protein
MSLLTTLNFALQAIAAMANAYTVWARNEVERDLDTLDDEIYKCIDDGSPAAKLRLKRLAGRRERKLRAINALRPADDPLTPPRAIPVQGGEADGEGTEIPQ